MSESEIGGKDSEGKIEAEISSLEKILNQTYKAPNLSPEFNFPEIEVEPIGAILEVFEIADWFCRYYDCKYAQLKVQLRDEDTQPFNPFKYRSLRRQEMTPPDKTFLKSKVDNLVLEDFATSQPPRISGKYFECKDREELSLDLTKLSACFDEFISNSEYSGRDHKIHSFDKEILGEFYHSEYRKELRMQLKKLKEREKVHLDPNCVKVARKLVSSLIELVKDAEKKIPEVKTRDDKKIKLIDPAKIKLYFQQLEETLDCTKITAGFHQDWRDNVFNSIDSCIHNNGSQRLASYQYSKDEKTHLLFFHSADCDKEEPHFKHVNKTLAPSAEAILMETAEEGRKGLVVEGVVFDDYFYGLQPTDGTTINRFITTCIKKFKGEKCGKEYKFDLNIREVTNEKELPTLYYLEDVCTELGLKFSFKKIKSPKDKSVSWFVTKESCEAYKKSHRPDLRKDNSSLDDKVYTHTWGNLFDLNEGGITDGQTNKARVVDLNGLLTIPERDKTAETITESRIPLFPAEPHNYKKKPSTFVERRFGLIAALLMLTGGIFFSKMGNNIKNYLGFGDSDTKIEMVASAPLSVLDDDDPFFRPPVKKEVKSEDKIGTKTTLEETRRKEKTDYLDELVTNEHTCEQTILPDPNLSEEIVKSVIDGDDFRLKNDLNIRIACIDAPDIYDDGNEDYYAEEAQEYLRQLISCKKVRLSKKDIPEKSTEKDNQFGRFTRHVYVTDSATGKEVLVAKEMVRKGYAALYAGRYSSEICAELGHDQNYALGKKLGIFGEENPVFSAKFICKKNFLDCKDFDSCTEVMEYFNGCGGKEKDIHKLDGPTGEVEGLPCESLCSKPVPKLEEKEEELESLTTEAIVKEADRILKELCGKESGISAVNNSEIGCKLKENCESVNKKECISWGNEAQLPGVDFDRIMYAKVISKDGQPALEVDVRTGELIDDNQDISDTINVLYERFGPDYNPLHEIHWPYQLLSLFDFKLEDISKQILNFDAEEIRELKIYRGCPNKVELEFTTFDNKLLKAVLKKEKHCTSKEIKQDQRNLLGGWKFKMERYFITGDLAAPLEERKAKLEELAKLMETFAQCSKQDSHKQVRRLESEVEELLREPCLNAPSSYEPNDKPNNGVFEGGEPSGSFTNVFGDAIFNFTFLYDRVYDGNKPHLRITCLRDICSETASDASGIDCIGERNENNIGFEIDTRNITQVELRDNKTGDAVVFIYEKMADPQKSEGVYKTDFKLPYEDTKHLEGLLRPFVDDDSIEQKIETMKDSPLVSSPIEKGGETKHKLESLTAKTITPPVKSLTELDLTVSDTALPSADKVKAQYREFEVSDYLTNEVYFNKNKYFLLQKRPCGIYSQEVELGENMLLSNMPIFTATNKIFFTSNAHPRKDLNGLELFVYDISESKSAQLTDNSYPDYLLDANSKQVICLSHPNSGPEIKMMNLDGSNQQVVTKIDSVLTSMAWSPNGELMAFGVSGKRKGSDIYLMDEKRNKRVIVLGIESKIAWSSDSKKIIYSKKTQGIPQILYYDLASAKEVYVTEGENPSFHPFGEKIAFLYTGDSNKGRFYTTNLKGDNRTLLIDNLQLSGESLVPKWSLDGNYLIFKMKRLGEECVRVLYVSGNDKEGVLFCGANVFKPTFLPIALSKYTTDSNIKQCLQSLPHAHPVAGLINDVTAGYAAGGMGTGRIDLCRLLSKRISGRGDPTIDKICALSHEKRDKVSYPHAGRWGEVDVGHMVGGTSYLGKPLRSLPDLHDVLHIRDKLSCGEPLDSNAPPMYCPSPHIVWETGWDRLMRQLPFYEMISAFYPKECNGMLRKGDEVSCHIRVGASYADSDFDTNASVMMMNTFPMYTFTEIDLNDLIGNQQCIDKTLPFYNYYLTPTVLNNPSFLMGFSFDLGD